MLVMQSKFLAIEKNMCDRMTQFKVRIECLIILDLDLHKNLDQWALADTLLV